MYRIILANVTKLKDPSQFTVTYDSDINKVYQRSKNPDRWTDSRMAGDCFLL